MKVLFVLITAGDSRALNIPDLDSKLHSVNGISFKTSYKLFGDEGQGQDVELFWLRPQQPDGLQALKDLHSLEPTMVLTENANGYEFSLQVKRCLSISLKSRIGLADAILIMIRHWIKRPRAQSGIPGFSWYLSTPGRSIKAEYYFGEDLPRSVVGFRPFVFLAGLRSSHEGGLFEGDNLLFWWPIQETLPYYNSWEGRAEEIKEQAAAPRSDAVSPPRSDDFDASDRKLVVWMYSTTGPEQAIAEQASSLQGQDCSRLVVIAKNSVSSPRVVADLQTAKITENVEVRAGDLVLSHSFDRIQTFKNDLLRMGVRVIDYSPEDKAWSLFVGLPLTVARTMEEVREALIAYYEDSNRQVSDLIRRVLHRSVNRLAPLRIDVSVLEELARINDRMGLADQVSDMRVAWVAQPESRPLNCVVKFHYSLAGRIANMPVRIFGYVLPLADTSDEHEALCNQLDDIIDFGEIRQLLERLVLCSGLYRHGDGKYYLDDKSEIWRYLYRLEEAVLGVDTRDKTLEFVRELAGSAQEKSEADLIARWAQLSNFSYATWLEEISSLLEMLCNETEGAEGQGL